MILLCDIGNTRFKWAVLDEHGLGAQRAEPYAGWGVTQVRALRSESMLVENRPFEARIADVAEEDHEDSG